MLNPVLGVLLPGVYAAQGEWHRRLGQASAEQASPNQDDKLGFRLCCGINLIQPVNTVQPPGTQMPSQSITNVSRAGNQRHKMVLHPGSISRPQYATKKEGLKMSVTQTWQASHGAGMDASVW
jgi:hypothetical protein